MKSDNINYSFNLLLLPIEVSAELLDTISWKKYFQLIDVIRDCQYHTFNTYTKLFYKILDMNIDGVTANKICKLLFPFVVDKKYHTREFKLEMTQKINALPFTRREVEYIYERCKNEN